MRNVGPVSQRWLAEIEIFSQADLKQVGAVAAWIHLKNLHPEQVSKNLLWALIGAEMDLDWREIPDEIKQQALQEVNLASK